MPKGASLKHEDLKPNERGNANPKFGNLNL